MASCTKCPNTIEICLTTFLHFFSATGRPHRDIDHQNLEWDLHIFPDILVNFLSSARNRKVCDRFYIDLDKNLHFGGWLETEKLHALENYTMIQQLYVSKYWNLLRVSQAFIVQKISSTYSMPRFSRLKLSISVKTVPCFSWRINTNFSFIISYEYRFTKNNVWNYLWSSVTSLRFKNSLAPRSCGCNLIYVVFKSPTTSFST